MLPVRETPATNHIGQYFPQYLYLPMMPFVVKVNRPLWVASIIHRLTGRHYSIMDMQLMQCVPRVSYQSSTSCSPTYWPTHHHHSGLVGQSSYIRTYHLILDRDVITRHPDRMSWASISRVGRSLCSNARVWSHVEYNRWLLIDMFCFLCVYSA